jgi:hypothetical protein
LPEKEDAFIESDKTEEESINENNKIIDSIKKDSSIKTEEEQHDSE